MTRKKRKALATSHYDLFAATVVTVQPTERAAGEVLPEIEEIYRRFRQFNIQYFAGKLPTPRIRYSDRLLAAGLYVRDRMEIVISRRYHELFPEDIDDTLKHEMIHILHFNHDAAFKKEAERIGSSCRAKMHPSLRLPSRYVYQCPSCRAEYPRRRRLRMASCGKCSPLQFDRRFKLVLKSSLKQIIPARSGPFLTAGIEAGKQRRSHEL